MYLITGSAGFIGFHTCLKLLHQNKKVLGIDNLDDYYDVNLKKKRVSILKKEKNFIFIKVDIVDKKKIKKIFDTYKIKNIIHLAAQAGVRYSIKHPEKYIDVNVKGFFNIIDNAKKNTCPINMRYDFHHPGQTKSGNSCLKKDINVRI